jgi:hypothetical protein
MHKTHMANFIISIGLLSLQYTHPWVFFAIIHGLLMIYYLIANMLLEKAIIT